MKNIFGLIIVYFSIVLVPTQVIAQEIANGIRIKVEKLAIPINEQPYYGFLPKTADQKAADEKLVTALLARGGTRQSIANELAKAGWQGIMRSDWSTASKRFNQATLFDSSLSEIAHGFAIIVAERDRSPGYSEELFKAAGQLKNPLPSLPADYARLLLINRRPADAIPLLQKAIVQTPNWEVPYANLASAYVDLGKMKEACEALKKIPANSNPNIRADVQRVSNLAKCQ